ncbi:taste receptor type 2 member 7-like, partial [Bufo gargarizans]|uniref:taste receptor type 2 member 7-like n=1 Tax=Bufo gargarizans TaxID=30331 RepID=UPI001CF1780B
NQIAVGLVIHSFIIAVNVNDWWKGRSVTPVDHIVTSVCISRICSQSEFVLYSFVDTLSMKNKYSFLTLGIMGTISMFFTYVNFWLTALLSIVFCLKISNFQTRLFLYLRRIIVQRTAYFIVASVLLSTFNCLIFLSTVITQMTKGGTNNVTMDDVFTDCKHNNSMYIYTIGTFFPLLFCCISSILLFISLYHHITRMKMSNMLVILGPEKHQFCFIAPRNGIPKLLWLIYMVLSILELSFLGSEVYILEFRN